VFRHIDGGILPNYPDLRFWSDEQIDHVHNLALPLERLQQIALVVDDDAEMADSEDEARLAVINEGIGQKVASVKLCQNGAVFPIW
jgi:hypothetical protein